MQAVVLLVIGMSEMAFWVPQTKFLPIAITWSSCVNWLYRLIEVTCQS
jgi:hypothetical protein